jgi:hypothetical protein
MKIENNFYINKKLKFAIFVDNCIFANITYDIRFIFFSDEFSPVFNTPNLIFLKILEKIEKEVKKYENYQR